MVTGLFSPCCHCFLQLSKFPKTWIVIAVLNLAKFVKNIDPQEQFILHCSYGLFILCHLLLKTTTKARHKFFAPILLRACVVLLCQKAKCFRSPHTWSKVSRITKIIKHVWFCAFSREWPISYKNFVAHVSKSVSKVPRMTLCLSKMLSCAPSLGILGGGISPYVFGMLPERRDPWQVAIAPRSGWIQKLLSMHIQSRLTIFVSSLLQRRVSLQQQ